MNATIVNMDHRFVAGTNNQQSAAVTGAAVVEGSTIAANLSAREDYAWVVVDGDYAVLLTIDGATDPDPGSSPRVGMPILPFASFYMNRAQLEGAKFICEDAAQTVYLKVQGGNFSY